MVLAHKVSGTVEIQPAGTASLRGRAELDQGEGEWY
jgi:hypothetical protein